MHDGELMRELGEALAPPAGPGPSAERVADLRALVAAPPAAPVDEPVDELAGARRRRARRSRFTARDALAAAVVGVLLGVAGGLVASRSAPGPPTSGTASAVEYDGLLTGEGDQAVTGSATVTRTGTGRVVRIASDDLPALPAGDYYEVWFVARGDEPGRPDRVSAGTFHPDGQGRSSVQLAAAVEPARYPDLIVTAEPGDGDPAPTGPVVLRAELRPR